jgi:hypothetical protein
MKHVQLFEQFINEKAYQMTGSYGAKGIAGKVLFAFKKEVERIKYENGDADATLSELNEIWSYWADRDGAEIIEKEVMKVVKDKEAIVFLVATLSNAKWIADVVNKINQPGSVELYVCLNCDFVINVGFADDVDANKFERKLDGMTNTPLGGSQTSIIGELDPAVGYNNVEIRNRMYLTIDAK